jgi:hypothetical protein
LVELLNYRIRQETAVETAVAASADWRNQSLPLLETLLMFLDELLEVIILWYNKQTKTTKIMVMCPQIMKFSKYTVKSGEA